MILDVIHY